MARSLRHHVSPSPAPFPFRMLRAFRRSLLMLLASYVFLSLTPRGILQECIVNHKDEARTGVSRPQIKK